MIKYTRNEDGTYTKSGEFPADYSGPVQLKIGGKSPFGSYTLAEAVKFTEYAIAKGQVKADLYSIVPSARASAPTAEEKTEVAESSEPKERRERVGKKYSKDDFVTIFQAAKAEGKDDAEAVKAVVTATGASYVWVDRVLKQRGVLQGGRRKKVVLAVPTAASTAPAEAPVSNPATEAPIPEPPTESAA